MRKTRGQHLQDQRKQVRETIWPNVDEETLWHWKRSTGFVNIPRAMPLILRIMDELSPGKPLSSTYLELWCRTMDDSYVQVKNLDEMAFYAGFSGQRKVHTWKARITLLSDLGFIDIQPGVNPIGYILILNPYKAIRNIWNKNPAKLQKETYFSLVHRAQEIGAKELKGETDPTDPLAGAAQRARVNVKRRRR